jgi:integrase
MATIRKRVGPKGIRYMAIVRREGQSRTATFRTKSEAKKWAGLIEAEITEGKNLPNTEAKRKTVRDLLERYIRSEIPRKRDQKNPERYANFWIDRIGNLKLAQLTRAKVVEVRDELAEDRSPATVNRYVGLLSHACTMAEREWEWMDTNPIRKVARLSEPQGRVRYLSDDERDRLLGAAKDSSHPHLYAIVLLALTSGARKGEILGLHWKDVDLASAKAILHDTKNEDRRTLTLVPQVVVELRALKKVRRIDTDLIFTHPATGKANPFYFDKAWREARDKAKLKDFRFHDLRHSCASYLAMNGATTAEIAAVLGHRTFAMVKRYSHLSDEHVRGVVERMAIKVLGDE